MKSLQEVKIALAQGAPVISVDLSDKLHPEALGASAERLDREFGERIHPGDAEVLLHLFTEREFRIQGSRGALNIRFDEEETKRNALLFRDAVDFCEEVYEFIRSETGYRHLVDFEVSMDGAAYPIMPENHLFFTIVLSQRGVRMDSFVLRFGMGFSEEAPDRDEEKELRKFFYEHTLIAQTYGDYRVSIGRKEQGIAAFADPVKLSP
jgi:hypothetical protein